jgi:hypothetical protein
MLKELEERIVELTKSAEQGIANHNFLLGSLNEAKHLLEVYLAKIEDECPAAPFENGVVCSDSNP